MQMKISKYSRFAVPIFVFISFLHRRTFLLARSEGLRRDGRLHAEHLGLDLFGIPAGCRLR